MTAMLEFLARLAVWLLLAPLLPGIINKVKAWVAGRRGPPVLQLYYDLARLWRKGIVLSTLASPGFIAGPAVAWVAVLATALPSTFLPPKVRTNFPVSAAVASLPPVATEG